MPIFSRRWCVLMILDASVPAVFEPLVGISKVPQPQQVILLMWQAAAEPRVHWGWPSSSSGAHHTQSHKTKHACSNDAHPDPQEQPVRDMHDRAAILSPPPPQMRGACPHCGGQAAVMAAEGMSILPRGDGGGLVGVLDVGGRSAQCSIVDTAGTAEVQRGLAGVCG